MNTLRLFLFVCVLLSTLALSANILPPGKSQIISEKISPRAVKGEKNFLYDPLLYPEARISVQNDSSLVSHTSDEPFIVFSWYKKQVVASLFEISDIVSSSERYQMKAKRGSIHFTILIHKDSQFSPTTIVIEQDP